MNARHPTQIPVQAPSGAAETLGAGLTTLHAFAVDLPLRLTAETMRFASRRLQAQAEHLSALSRCGSLTDLVELQTAFMTSSVSDYREEATTLSRDVQATAFAKAA